MTVPALRSARRTTVRGDSTGGGADPRSPERWRWINLVLVQGTPDRLREVRSAGSEIDAVLSAYKGSLGTGLIQIAQSDPSGSVDTMALALKAGQVVKLAVDGEHDVVDEGIVLLNYRYDLPQP